MQDKGPNGSTGRRVIGSLRDKERGLIAETAVLT
jgi:hypothetical protein